MEVFTWTHALISATVIPFTYFFLNSFIKEPYRQQFNALMVAGAGAAYFSGSIFDYWEFGFAMIIVYLALRGLKQYYFIGIAWLMHTTWDTIHHFNDNPLLPFAPTSSAGCAVTDVVLAIWFFYGAPSVFDWFRKRRFGRL